MAARRKSTRKNIATATKHKTASAVRTTRGSKRSKVPVKSKAKSASSKRARKASGTTGLPAQSATRRPTKAQQSVLSNARKPAKTKKKGDRAKGKISKTAGAPNTKRVEASLRTKIQQKSEAKVVVRSSVQNSKTGTAVPEGNNTMSSNSSSEASEMKATTLASKELKAASRETQAVASKTGKPGAHRQGFKLNEFVVYPAHGVGQIIAIEEQEVAGFKLELFVISFSKDKMTLRVPTSKGAGVGMRKISDPDTAKRSLEILTGRARIKRTMWSRRAQEYEAKINSGDINAIAEVVRDLYRSDAQPEQSYSERQLYEAALDRMVREIAAVQRTTELDALRTVEAQLQRSHGRSSKTTAAAGSEAVDPEIEEAA